MSGAALGACSRGNAQKTRQIDYKTLIGELHVTSNSKAKMR